MSGGNIDPSQGTPSQSEIDRSAREAQIRDAILLAGKLPGVNVAFADIPGLQVTVLPDTEKPRDQGASPDAA